MDNEPEWWPENPYPESIFPMTPEQYSKAIPDEKLRTAISGHLARFGWNVARRQFLAVFKEYSVNPENLVDIREVIQCLTDSNALLEDLQRTHEILPDTKSGNRKMTCDDARAAYKMGDFPYDSERQEQHAANMKRKPAWVTQEQLDLMRHTVGLDTGSKPHRNYFSADKGHADIQDLRELVDMGLMGQARVSGTPDLMFYLLDRGYWMLGLEYRENQND